MDDPKRPEGKNGSTEPLDLKEDFEEILTAGHRLLGYSTSQYERVVVITGPGSQEEELPFLGIGVGQDAEDALTKARDSFRRREDAGLDYIPNEWHPPENSSWGGPPTTDLDWCFWDGYIEVFREGGTVVLEAIDSHVFHDYTGDNLQEAVGQLPPPDPYSYYVTKIAFKD